MSDAGGSGDQGAGGSQRVSSQLTPGAGSAFRGWGYAKCSSLFVGFFLISNVVAVKPILFGSFAWGEWSLPLVFDGGVFLFPLVYVLGDVIAEVYGLRASRRTIFLAFGVAFLAALTIFVVQISPPAQGWGRQQAFEAVLGFVPRIVVASLAGFLVGQLLNAWVVDVLRRRDAGRFLRTRLMVSTFVGELADTLVFCTIAFAGIITGVDFVMYVVLGYVVKVLAELVLLPVTTRVIASVRRAEAQLA